MAIAFDTQAGVDGGAGANPSYNHFCADDATVLLVAINVENNNCVCNYPASVAYAGEAMTLITGATRCQCNTGSNLCHTLRIYALINPASGTNTVAVTIAAFNSKSVASASYTGTALTNWFLGVCTNGQAPGTTTIACTATGVVDGWFFYAYSWGIPINAGGTTFTPGTQRRNQAAAGRMTMGIADESFPAGGARLHTAGSNWAVWPNIIGLGMKPAPPIKGRTIKYFYDFWSPEPRVRDETGRIVPPNEIRPDEWIEAEGLALPTMNIPDSAIEEAGRSRIIEVNASDRAATLKTSKSQFAQVIIERAAAGRG